MDKPKVLKWERPSGSSIETNDLEATIAAAKSLGWVLKSDKKKRKVAKK